MRFRLLLPLLFLILSACTFFTPKEKDSPKSEWTAMNTSANEFDGWTFHRNNGEKNGWSITDGVMTYDPSKDNTGTDSSLLSKEQYRNFEISFEWNAGEYANSGFLWGVRDIEELDHTFDTGREIQIIDPVFYQGQPENQKYTAGALYDMIAPSKEVTRPSGEWNKYVISINYDTNLGVLVHNDVEVLRFPLHGDAWDEMIQNSKFKTWTHFGKYQKGHISLQSHGPMDNQYAGTMSFKNIKIKRLD